MSARFIHRNNNPFSVLVRNLGVEIPELYLWRIDGRSWYFTTILKDDLHLWMEMLQLHCSHGNYLVKYWCFPNNLTKQAKNHYDIYWEWNSGIIRAYYNNNCSTWSFGGQVGVICMLPIATSLSASIRNHISYIYSTKPWNLWWGNL